jgi:glycosyltransferase involved in cell wall biosynthesis
MRILHTEASTGWGGQDIRVLAECLEMRRRGHEVVLACMPGCPLWNAAHGSGLNMEALEFGRRLKPAAVRAVVQLIRRHRIEIVNTHSSADGWSGAVAARLARVIHVRTRHLSNPLKNNRANLFLYRKLTDAVITTGEPLRRKLIADNGLDGSRIISAPTGIDIARFDPEQYNRSLFRTEIGIDDDVFLWTIVAVLRKAKGLPVLVEAAALLKETHPHAHIAVVGGVTGPSPLPAELEERARKLGLEQHMHWMGMRSDVPHILKASDGFVLPSLAEGVPQSITQAQAMGLPVVATNVGGIPEVVREGKTGLLVPSEDAPALADAMRKVMDDNDFAHELGTNSYRMIREEYSLAAMTDRVEGLYQKLLASR